MSEINLGNCVRDHGFLMERIGEFHMALAKKVEAHYKAKFPELTIPSFIIEHGKTYAKVIKVSGGQSSVHCFIALRDVDTKTIKCEAGDILKAATWKAPAKHPRGSVFCEDPTEGVGVYGADYL